MSVLRTHTIVHVILRVSMKFLILVVTVLLDIAKRAINVFVSSPHLSNA